MISFKNHMVMIMAVVFTAVAAAQEPQGDSSGLGVPPEAAENAFTPKDENHQAENFQLRSVDKNKIDSLKSLSAFWYADSVFKKKKKEVTYYLDSTGGKRGSQRAQPKDNGFRAGGGLGTGFILIIVLIILAIIIFLLVQNNFVGSRKRIDTNEPEQPEETENIFEINYQKEIEKAIADKNYRLATRLMFLRILKGLATKNIIQYKQERTNLDYLMQLHASPYYREFFRLTRSYEYVWYGKFNPPPDVFAVIKSEFENFDRKLN